MASNELKMYASLVVNDMGGSNLTTVQKSPSMAEGKKGHI
jgi:hypothetical protein